MIYYYDEKSKSEYYIIFTLFFFNLRIKIILITVVEINIYSRNKYRNTPFDIFIIIIIYILYFYLNDHAFFDSSFLV